jgi:PD-(D/E)XK endonuclease
MSNESVIAEPRLKRRRRTLATEEHCKRKGELAELAFAYKARSLGFAVCRPYGDSEPYDLVTENHGRLVRVQVKSVFTTNRWGYAITVTHKHNMVGYSPEEIDFVAAYVAPHDAWYIIPLEKMINRRYIRLYPQGSRKDDGGGWEKYREAWDLLRAPTPPPTPAE